MNGHALVGGVVCEGSCAVRGPGDISGASAGIFIFGTTGTQKIRGVTLHDNIDGIGDQAGTLILRDVVSSNNVTRGIFLQAGSIKGRNVTAWNNGVDAIHVSQGAVRLTKFTAVGNGHVGLINNSDLETVLVDSVLKGHPGDISGPRDLFSVTPPRLVRTACDHSRAPGGSSWSVCAGD